jgi:hypothetical protein
MGALDEYVRAMKIYTVLFIKGKIPGGTNLTRTWQASAKLQAQCAENPYPELEWAPRENLTRLD